MTIQRITPEQVLRMPGLPSVDYELDRPPFTRYRWDGTQMVEMGAVSGDGLPLPDYRTPFEQALAQAVRLRATTSAPTVPETAPTNKSAGNTYYIDGIAGNNSNAGNTPTAPWKDAWKIPGGGMANGGTLYLAADAVYEYAQDWATYKADSLFPSNVSGWTGTAALPITVRPYYPRGASSSKPRISWFALMQAADWTQESSISGGKVWSASWAKAGNTYYNTFVAFGATRAPGVAWLQQGTSGVPASLNKAGHYTVDATKVYVYVPDGSNPVSYYGEVRVFGGNNQAIFRANNGVTQFVRFFGLQFELCQPFQCYSGASTNSVDSIEVAYCNFIKVAPSMFRNASTYASALESSLSWHDNYHEDLPWAAVKLNSPTGTAGNMISWELYRNKVVRANISTGIGAGLLYNQCLGGTKHIAWGNYLYDCRTGYGGEQIDGCGIYSDYLSDKAIFAGNIAERCGKGFQFNSMSGMGVMVANLAIDCGSFGSITNTAGDLKAPSVIAVHNTYLWTGRIAFSDLSVGSNIGGTGVADWSKEPVFEFTNSQANQTGNTAYNFGALTLANNAALNLSGTQMTNKRFARVPETWTTTLMIAGNASSGLAATLIAGTNSGTDYTNAARYMALIGSIFDAATWVERGAQGVARPGKDSPLVGAGALLSQQYQDIGGRNFAAAPTIGCYEVNA